MAGLPLPTCADVVVIGSGAGGGSIAHRLAFAGARVLLLEAGGFLSERAQSDEAVGTYLREIHPDRRQPISCVGGQTKFYGAALYRLRQADFQAREHECGTSATWPVGYEILEPYYRQAEILYAVHGTSDVDATDPPRSSPYPFPAIGYDGVVQTVVERLAQSGTPVSPIPLALDRRGGEGACSLCASCDAHHCRVDGKMDAEIAAIRPALSTGNLHVATHTTCLQVLTTLDGRRVSGVLVERNGERTEIPADRVVVAAGVPRSIELLRRSRNGAHPEGLGNAGKALGKYVGGHSAGVFMPLISRHELPPTNTKSFAINHFYHDAPDWPFPSGVIQTIGQMPLWSEAPRFTRSAARYLSKRALTCCFMTEALPHKASGFSFEGDRIAAWRSPAVSRATFQRLGNLGRGLFRTAGYRSLAPPGRAQLWHRTGGARMGNDPGTSVVDPNLQVHGVSGLHVVDATVLPSAGAVNTALTIIALALRCADVIAG